MSQILVQQLFGKEPPYFLVNVFRRRTKETGSPSLGGQKIGDIHGDKLLTQLFKTPHSNIRVTGSAANEFLIDFSIATRHDDGMDDVGWEILQEFDPLVLNLDQISLGTPLSA
eukprot:scaffold43013_cov52-Attheya_sp.AAC.2